MGLGQIPWHECLRWAEHEGFDEEETDSLIELISRLDLEEAKLADADQKRNQRKRDQAGDGEDS